MRKSKVWYWTLLRPKYWPSTTDGATAATVATRIIDRVRAPANRRMRSPCAVRGDRLEHRPPHQPGGQATYHPPARRRHSNELRSQRPVSYHAHATIGTLADRHAGLPHIATVFAIKRNFFRASGRRALAANGLLLLVAASASAQQPAPPA